MDRRRRRMKQNDGTDQKLQRQIEDHVVSSFYPTSVQSSISAHRLTHKTLILPHYRSTKHCLSSSRISYPTASHPLSQRVRSLRAANIRRSISLPLGSGKRIYASIFLPPIRARYLRVSCWNSVKKMVTYRFGFNVVTGFSQSNCFSATLQ